MADEPQTPRTRASYHHGNLREALIEAALELIRERGPAGFSLSDAAKMAGVTPAAPYRHFKDRKALLQDIARQGAQKHADFLASAMREAKPEEAFEAMGRAYLAFARQEPAYYEVLFNSGLSSDQPSTGMDPSSFTLLQQALAQRLNGSERLARAAAFLIFALSHGIATLTRPGQSVLGAEAPPPEWFLQVGVGALLRGLPDAVSACPPPLKPTR